MYRSISALTALIRLSAKSRSYIGPFFAAVSEAEPIIERLDAAVETLDDSKPEAQHFRLLLNLAKASIDIHGRSKASKEAAYSLRQSLIGTLYEYRCASAPLPIAKVCSTDIDSA